MASDAEIEAAARKLAGQYQVDDGYGEASRESAEKGEMWRNFKMAATVALDAAARVRVVTPFDITAPCTEAQAHACENSECWCRI